MCPKWKMDPLSVNWGGSNLGRFYVGHLGRWSDQRKRGTMGWGPVGGRVSVAPVVRSSINTSLAGLRYCSRGDNDVHTTTSKSPGVSAA